MTEKIYRDADVDMAPLQGKTVAVIGYGIQGKAQAANARDSGVKVIVGTRSAEESPSRKQAEADGFAAYSIGEATRLADVLLIELADPAQPPIYKAEIAPHLSAGKTICFCHGFNVLYGAIQPPKDVNTVLFVPNAPGHFVRQKYLAGEGARSVTLADLTGTLGGGWSRAGTGVFGEFMVQNILLSGLPNDRTRVQAAAAGWGGDAWSLYVTGDSRLLQASITWDTAEDAAEFWQTLLRALTSRGASLPDPSVAAIDVTAGTATWRAKLDGATTSLLLTNDPAVTLAP